MIYRDVLSTLLEVMQARVAPAGHTEHEHNTENTMAGAEVIDSTDQDGLVGRIKGLLGSGQGGAELGRILAAELEPSAPCPVCQYTLKQEKELAGAFAAALAHHDFIEAYRRHTTGLCIPHLRQVLQRTARAASVRALVRAQETKLALTLADLTEVIRKYDYRNRDEAHGNEFKVPARSVEQASGSLPTQINLP
jgi:hypothetical protein